MAAEQSPTKFIEDHPALGTYVSHHPSRRDVLIARGFLIYGLPVGALSLLYASDERVLVAVVLPVLFGIWGLAAFWYVAHLWNREVILYEQGFTYREGSRLATFFYHEIVVLRAKAERIDYLRLLRRTRYQYTLISNMDETITITNLYSDIDQLTQRLEVFILRERLPILETQLRDGIAIDFADTLRLSKMGVEHDGRALSWQQFRGYRVDAGQLIIQSDKADSWAAYPLSELDNLMLLAALLKSQSPAPDSNVS